MRRMKDALLDMSDEEYEAMSDEGADYTDQEDDYKAQCAQLMDMVKKANQNTEALLAVLQKKSDEVDALLKERSTQQSGASVQWEYGTYVSSGGDYSHDYPAIGKFMRYDVNDMAKYFKYSASNTSLYDLGRAGWEVSASNFSNGSLYSIFLKRRIQ